MLTDVIVIVIHLTPLTSNNYLPKFQSVEILYDRKCGIKYFLNNEDYGEYGDKNNDATCEHCLLNSHKTSFYTGGWQQFLNPFFLAVLAHQL
jgi:hypothetical protein